MKEEVERKEDELYEKQQLLLENIKQLVAIQKLLSRNSQASYQQ